MRGAETGQAVLFSYVALEERIPADHPLRALKALIEPILAELSPRFDAIYEAEGRPSIPPEQLLRALLLQVLYTIRSERQLIERLDFDLLFRWFVGLGLDQPVWHATTFTKNRERLLAGDIAEAFLAGVVRQAQARGLLSRPPGRWAIRYTSRRSGRIGSSSWTAARRAIAAIGSVSADGSWWRRASGGAR
jgi:transposase